jgi:ferredoxin
MVTITVDKDKCIGCGLCVSVCPQTFELDKNGKSSVKKNWKGNCYKDAAESCPQSAISYK